MAQARLDKAQLEERQNRIDRIESQIQRWKILTAKEPGLDVLREAIKNAVAVEEKRIGEMVKTLSFATLPDQLELAKKQGRLESFNSIYYDIDVTKVSQKISSAEDEIARVASEIKRAKAGELIEVGENQI
jgi:hypothetical protein